MHKMMIRWKVAVYDRLFNVHTRSGKKVSVFLTGATLLSVALVFIESGTPDFLQLLNEKTHLFYHLEVIFTLIFTAEYLLRLFSAPVFSRYAFGFAGIVDLLTTLPLFILWMWPGIAVEYVTAMRLLRILRLFRIIKIMRYMETTAILWQTIHSSGRKLLVFFGFVILLLCLFGGIMYVIEGPENGFTNLPVSVYWAAVTMTTVGYGDITPHTPLGRVIASLLILIGYTIIAIPTGVLTTHMSDVMQRKRHARSCSRCRSSLHDHDALYCKRCGEKLPEPDSETHTARSG